MFKASLELAQNDFFRSVYVRLQIVSTDNQTGITVIYVFSSSTNTVRLKQISKYRKASDRPSSWVSNINASSLAFCQPEKNVILGLHQRKTENLKKKIPNTIESFKKKL